MTAEGKNVFSNLVWYGLDTVGRIFVDGFESGTTSRWSSVTP
jgi:hypothetical protein